jgi:hypothetical protein
MPGLVRSEPPPPADIKRKRVNVLGEAMREVLEVEQREMLAGVRDDLMAGIDRVLAEVRAGGAGAIKAVESLRSVAEAKPTAIDAAVAKLEKAFAAALDERMGDVVQALMALRADVKSSKKFGKWVGSLERAGGVEKGPITKIIFTFEKGIDDEKPR